MQRNRFFTVLVTAALLAACGDDKSSGGTTSESAVATTQPAVTTTQAADTTAVTTTEPVASTTSEPTQLEQPAFWPAADVVFDTPEAAAADFLANVFGEGPVLGDFMAGDQRSGEFEVFASVDGAAISTPRSVLAVRMLGPSDGWFVIAAMSDFATITSPESMALVAAGPLTVEGVARGFEATVLVSAFVAGQLGTEFGQEVVMAGNLDVALPYSVSLDLSGASAGDVIVLMVRGGTGLETDPGDFGAIPVVIGS